MLMQQIPWNLDTEAFIGHARLGRTPNFFQSERGISFIESVDGLDYYKAALLIRPDLIRVVLKQYRGSPQDSTIVYLSQDFHDVDEITRLVGEVVADLSLEADAILWQRRDNPEA